MKTIFSDSRVTPLRFALGLAAIAAWSAAMVLVARACTPAEADRGATFGALGALGAIAAGVLFTGPLCSLGEWLVHGVLYHGKIPGFAQIRRIHHAGHHFALFPPERYVQDGRFEFMRVREPLTPFRMSDNALDDALSKWGQVALHFVVGLPLIVLPAWWATRDPWFTGAVFATLSLVSWLLAYVHGAIHTPRDRFIEHLRWFQWLDRHHYVHHVDLGANINFMLPLCDVLFGTEKRQLTDEEARAHPSFEAAKPMAKDIPPPR